MESARLVRPPLSPARTSVALIAALLVFAALGWAVTDERMRGMDAGPGTDPGSLGFYVTTWVVMMAAMMFPSIWPMVAMFAQIQDGKRGAASRSPRGPHSPSSGAISPLGPWPGCWPTPSSRPATRPRSTRSLGIAPAPMSPAV